MMKIIVTFLLFFTFVISSQEPVTYGGVAPISKNENQEGQFPSITSPTIESKYSLFYQYINTLDKPFTLEKQANEKEGRTKFILVGFDKERVTGGKFGNQCLWQYNLSARVILLEWASKTVLQAYPVGRSRNYVDNPENCSEKARDKTRDKFRFCQMLLGLETDSNYSQEEMVKNCENVGLDRLGNGLIKEVGNIVSNLDISDKRNIRFAGIGDVNITDRALDILSGKEGFVSHPFHSIDGKFKQQSYKDWISQYFVKAISTKLDVPLVLPFPGGIGGKAFVKLEDGSETEIVLPELDYSFDILIRGFAKSLVDETAQREAWIYGSYLTVDFGGMIGKESSKVKNGYVFKTVKDDFLNDWREFDNSVQQLAQEYADQLIKTDKKWVPQHTNMKYKDGKKYFSYIKEKLDSAK